MPEVVMDDMAIGNPAPPEGSTSALVSLFPSLPIAQFDYQVIGNCGTISLMQRSKEGGIKTLSGFFRDPSRQFDFGLNVP
jgi:hypothetical protein